MPHLPPHSTFVSLMNLMSLDTSHISGIIAPYLSYSAWLASPAQSTRFNYIIANVIISSFSRLNNIALY